MKMSTLSTQCSLRVTIETVFSPIFRIKKGMRSFVNTASADS
ncbi:MAG: hypothetical protein OFPI_40700 [Osedax symbiont Rs2]|nr:MAG: hypothetical protein OFPI_40700 [Osedax symbiont Rs2]